MRLGIPTCAEKPEITAGDQLSLAFAERRLGCEIVAVPWELHAAPDVDALVIRSTWGYYHHLPRFRTWLENLRVPTLNPVPLMLGNINKIYLKQMENLGVPIVPTIFFHSADPTELLAKTQNQGWQELVLKPTISASSHLTFRITARELPASGALGAILQKSEGMAQPFLKEIIEQGELSVIFHKGRGQRPIYSHALRKRPAQGDFRVQMEFGGRNEPYEPSAAVERFLEKVLATIKGEWLYARIDLVETKSGPLLCELELVEPYLFYEMPGADLEGFAEALASHLSL